MKQYRYKYSHYLIQMIIPGIFTILIGLYSLYQFTFVNHHIFYIFIMLLCFYNVWNLFISASNPSEIRIDNENVIFISFSKLHQFNLREIKQFSMRVMSGNGKIYMTINHGGLLKGRYWIRTEEFNDGEELTDFFYDLDEKVNPDSIVTTARKQGRKRLKDK